MPRLTTPVGRPARRATAALLAALLLATTTAFGTSAQAAAPDGWDDLGNWPTCVDDAATYCVQEATVTPVDGEPTAAADLGLGVSAAPLPGYVTSFNWAVSGWEEQSEAVRGGDVTLVLRVGQFAPRYTMALAREMRISRTTDDTGNTTMTITGHPVRIDWTTGDLFGSCVSGADCGNADTMADPLGTGYRFSGNTQDLATWDGDAATVLDGMYIASDAQARPTTIMFGSYPEPYWSMPMLGNVHLDVDGNPVRGSFNAWLPESYFAAVGSSAEEAATTGLDVVSREGGVSVSIPAGVTLRDAGVAVDVKDIGYSVHQIDVFSHGTVADPDTTTPGAPQQVASTGSAGGLGVSWAAPAQNGGSPVTGYTARAFTAASGGTVAGSCHTSGTSCTIGGLNDGVTYHLAASASNALGEGLPAADRLSATAGAPPATAPSAPTAVAATPGAGRLVTTWGAPGSTGGSVVTGYTARAYAASAGGGTLAQCTSVAPTRTCTLTGLTNGTRYHVAVRATNVAGTGPETTRVAAVPRTVPGTPRGVGATSTGARIRTTWSAPASTGGAAVTGYRVDIYGSSTTNTATAYCTATGAGRSCTSRALVVGRTYYVRVTASNAAGRSSATARVRVTVRR